jgi:hypothetical protein
MGLHESLAPFRIAASIPGTQSAFLSLERDAIGTKGLAIKNDSRTRDWRFNSFPRADSLLKTRRETRTVRFIGICRCVGIRQIDGTRSNFYLAVRVSGIPRQKSVDS